MNLKNVKVGQQVWSTFNPGWSERPSTVHLSTVTHIDKAGRLYICVKSHECICNNNWRYGFDPETGTAKESTYKGTQLSYASPEGIAAYTAFKEARVDEGEAKVIRNRVKQVFAEYGEAMYEALHLTVKSPELLATIYKAMAVKAKEWDSYRAEFRKVEASSVEVVWADLPSHIQRESPNQ